MEGKVTFPLLHQTLNLLSHFGGDTIKYVKPLSTSTTWLRKDKLRLLFASSVLPSPGYRTNKIFPPANRTPGYGRTSYISLPTTTPPLLSKKDILHFPSCYTTLLIMDGQVTFPPPPTLPDYGRTNYSKTILPFFGPVFLVFVKVEDDEEFVQIKTTEKIKFYTWLLGNLWFSFCFWNYCFIIIIFMFVSTCEWVILVMTFGNINELQLSGFEQRQTHYH